MMEVDAAELACQRMAREVERRKDSIDDVYGERRQLWKDLVAEGHTRTDIAKWSGVDVMVVSRAVAEDS